MTLAGLGRGDEHGGGRLLPIHDGNVRPWSCGATPRSLRLTNPPCGWRPAADSIEDREIRSQGTGNGPSPWGSGWSGACPGRSGVCENLGCAVGWGGASRADRAARCSGVNEATRASRRPASWCCVGLRVVESGGDAEVQEIAAKSDLVRVPPWPSLATVLETKRFHPSTGIALVGGSFSFYADFTDPEADSLTRNREFTDPIH